VVASFASTGKLYAQIKAGAPFDVLLAADQKTPARLEEEGDIVAGSRFTYATGRLVLWSARAGVVDPQGDVLRSATVDRLAIAHPRVAPYGAAAMEVLQAMGLVQALQPRIVQGEDIGQTYEFVATGNALLGFVALSQVMRDGAVTSGSAWMVPASLHAPLRQDAVLLKSAAHPAAARAWLEFLRSDAARALLRTFGYDA
jgi:molybdate transport system substrate-binding protein